MKAGNSKTIIIASAALSVLLVLGSLFGAWMLARGAQPASAQSENQSGSTGTPQQITVVGTGSISVKPDVLKITIGVSAQEDTVAAAQASVDSVTTAMIQKLQEMGIDEKDYATSQYNVEPVMDYNNSKVSTGTLVGFRVTYLYDITFRDPSQAPAVIDALTSAGANTIYSTYYTVSSFNDASKQAYDGAIKDAQDRADKIAALSNLTLGKIVSVSEVSSTPYYPVATKEGMGGGGSTIAPGQQTITTSLVVTYEAASK